MTWVRAQPAGQTTTNPTASTREGILDASHGQLLAENQARSLDELEASAGWGLAMLHM